MEPFVAVADDECASGGDIADRSVIDEPATCLEAPAENCIRGTTNRQAALFGESEDPLTFQHRSQRAASRYRRACLLQAPWSTFQHERRVASD